MRKALSVCAVFLISFGIIALAYAPVSNQIATVKNIKIISEFNTKRDNFLYSDDNDKSNVQIDINRLYNDSIAYNNNLKKHQSELLSSDTYTYPSLNLADYGITDGVYGYISAPSINMQLPIYLGASDYNMSIGAAHMTHTSLPVSGESTNVVLTAHTGYIGKVFFDNITKLQVDDEVMITNYWTTLSYKVKEYKVTKNNQSASCYIQKGKDLLTLITCISDGNGGFDRYVVVCERN